MSTSLSQSLVLDCAVYGKRNWPELLSIDNALASLAVKDLNAAVGWYTRVLGKAPDTRPMADVAEWKFERGGWLQVYQLPERAGSGSCTLAVSNIEAEVAQLAAGGVDTSDRPPGFDPPAPARYNNWSSHPRTGL